MYSKREIVVKILSFKYKSKGYSDITAEELVSRRLSEFRNHSYPKRVKKIAKRCFGNHREQLSGLSVRHRLFKDGTAKRRISSMG